MGVKYNESYRTPGSDHPPRYRLCSVIQMFRNWFCDWWNGDLSRIHSDATVLVVNMPNNNTLYTTSGAGRNAWRNYITSINALEAEANGVGVPLNLLSSVADSIKILLKSKIFN